MTKYFLTLLFLTAVLNMQAQAGFCDITSIKGKLISKTLISEADVKKAYLAEFEVIKAYDSTHTDQDLKTNTVIVMIRTKKYSPTLLETGKIYSFSVSPETAWDVLNYKRFGKKRLAKTHKSQCRLWAWGETFSEPTDE